MKKNDRSSRGTKVLLLGDDPGVVDSLGPRLNDSTLGSAIETVLDRCEWEKRLNERTLDLEAIFTNTPAFRMLVDPDGRVEKINFAGMEATVERLDEIIRNIVHTA